MLPVRRDGSRAGPQRSLECRAFYLLPLPAPFPQDDRVAHSLLVLVVACYAAAATAYAEARRRREAPPRWARLLGMVGVAAHLGGLVALGAQLGRSPFAEGAQSLSFVAWALGALYLLLESTSRVAAHGGGFYGAAALLSAVSVPGLLRGLGHGAAERVPDPLRTVHVGLALLSAAAVLAAGLLALGYLQAYGRVKRRAMDAGEEGPSLSGFERLERRACALAVLLLLPALALGMLTATREGSPAASVPLAMLTAALLALLAAAGFLWWRRPLRGALAAWLNLAAAAVLALAVLGIHPWLAGGRS